MLPRPILLALTWLLSTPSTLTTASSDSPSHHPRPRQVRPPSRPVPGRIGRIPKYFQEAGESVELSHYDQRFYRGQVPYQQHRLLLRKLIQSYLTVMADYGVETWLAHGTLLGWWWNGQTLPWDYDLDVQVSFDTLAWMAEHLNHTEHSFAGSSSSSSRSFSTVEEADADGKMPTASPRYMMDINPHYQDPTVGDAQNVIDARWIDMENGMFVDITGLKKRNMRTPSVWSCKNNHKYETRDLWPMRTSEFEGTKAKIPYHFEGVLLDEYGVEAIVVEQYNDHRWDSTAKEWVQENKTEALEGSSTELG